MTTLQHYNGMDTIATFQLWQYLSKKLADSPEASATYLESNSLQGPVFYSMLRGILVNREKLEPLREQLRAEQRQLEVSLDFITQYLGMDIINIASPTQVRWLLQCLSANIPTKTIKGVKTLRTDREGLEQIAKADLDLSPLINILLEWRNHAKMLQALEDHSIDRDDRMRTFYKIGGTVTDRFASSKNPLWSGMNMQNIKRDEDESKTGHASVRSIFIADPGYKFGNIDLERADSWAVALEVLAHTGDDSYLIACDKQDLHTYVSSLVWPDLGWNGDPGHDKALAEQFFYRQYDYRFMSKKAGHGSNYLGKARTLAVQMKVPRELAEAFQKAYFTAFPGIPLWHAKRASDLMRHGYLINLLGRRRDFHSRLEADATLREAIAYLGQSVTSGVIRKGILAIWAVMMARPDLDIQYLAQVHDSVLFQAPEEHFEESLSLILQAMKIPLTVVTPKGETVTRHMPLEAKVGWNWAAQSPANPDGLLKLKPGAHDGRERQEEPQQKKLRLMDRRLSALY